MKNPLLLITCAGVFSLLAVLGCKKENPSIDPTEYEPSANAIAVRPLEPIDPAAAIRIVRDGTTWKQDITSEVIPAASAPPAEAMPTPMAAPGSPMPGAGDPNAAPAMPDVPAPRPAYNPGGF